MANQAACRSCGAAIRWVTTQKGKKMPLDWEPVTGGSFILEPDGESVVFIGPKDKYTGERYDSHFQTCPHADEHRPKPPR